MAKGLAARVSNSADVIDSRDILERIEELENQLRAVECSYCDGDGCDKCDSGTVDLGAIIADPNHDNTHTAPQVDYWGDEMNELRLLRALVEEIDQNAGDNARDGAGLIRDSYFQSYAQEMAEDIGAIGRDMQWPGNCIDWKEAAEQLQQDYSTIDYDGVTYWVRA